MQTKAPFHITYHGNYKLCSDSVQRMHKRLDNTDTSPAPLASSAYKLVVFARQELTLEHYVSLQGQVSVIGYTDACCLI